MYVCRCKDREEILPLVESFVFVQHSNKPVITVAGNNIVMDHSEHFEEGVNVFKVSINISALVLKTNLLLYTGCMLACLYWVYVSFFIPGVW